jgi:ABC-type cobalamin/Fe3+-siderophores transport system ATPase subunit
MKVIILNASPGAGKTTLLKQLEKNLPEGSAIIDGDDVGRIVPIKLTIEWLNLIQDNIVSCANNFKQYGTKTLVISFVLPTKERVSRLENKLRRLGMETQMICMHCADKILEERITSRNTSKIVNVERALEINTKIKDLNANICIDTSGMSPQEVMYSFMSALKNIKEGE